MGLIDLNDVVGFAIGKAENKLQGKEKEEKTTVGGAILRFIVSVIWFLLTLVVSFAALAAMMGGALLNFYQELGLIEDADSSGFFIAGIGASLALFFITFLIPYLRKKGSFTRWCGIICLGDAIWYIFLILSNSI